MLFPSLDEKAVSCLAAGVESLLSVSSGYNQHTHQLRTRFAADLEPLLRRQNVLAPPRDQPELQQCAETSATLRRLLDAQSAICGSVHSWRESAERMAELLESNTNKRRAEATLDGRADPTTAVLSNSLSPASL